MERMDVFFTWQDPANRTQRDILSFHFANDMLFPLSIAYHWRLVCALYYLIIICAGIVFRSVILRYLTDQDTKSTPINWLIWLQQLNGLFAGTFNLSVVFTVLILESSLKSLLGDQVCHWLPLSGCINLVGYLVWSCLIAIYRILYIKAQDWVKFTIGERRLLVIILIFGLLLHGSIAGTMFYHDDENITGRACSHYSVKDLEITLDYKVR